MIVPRSRLLFWVAAIVLPFALAGAVAPAAGGWCGLFVGLLAALAVADAVGGRNRLAGVSVALPPIARMSKDHEAKLEVRLRNESRRRRTVRIGLAWPREVPAERDVMDVVLPEGSEWSRLAWACRPRRRGNYPLACAGLESPSPLGFWAVRKIVPVRSELRVYPDLARDRKHLAALFLHRGAFGMHAQRQVGKGREFEKLREYIAGDSFDEIHWKATARRGRPITKVFQIERTQEVYVIVDASRLSARPAGTGTGDGVSGARSQASGIGDPESGGPTPDTSPLAPGASILERCVTGALVLGLAAEQQGDLFGLLTFSDRVDRFVRARNGQAHYRACRDALYTLQSRTVTPDFDELCTFIRLRLRRRALLVFLTSLDDPALAESFVRNMEWIRRQHLVLANMLRPPGAVPLFTDPTLTAVDDLYRHLAGHLQWRRLRELASTLRRRGVQFALLPNERLSVDLVSQYLSVKQRQLL
jgi:uncharacterized protein (DUF58 family)